MANAKLTREDLDRLRRTDNGECTYPCQREDEAAEALGSLLDIADERDELLKMNEAQVRKVRVADKIAAKAEGDMLDAKAEVARLRGEAFTESEVSLTKFAMRYLANNSHSGVVARAEALTQKCDRILAALAERKSTEETKHDD